MPITYKKTIITSCKTRNYHAVKRKTRESSTEPQTTKVKQKELSYIWPQILFCTRLYQPMSFRWIHAHILCTRKEHPGKKKALD
jgi:hypothetical protein